MVFVDALLPHPGESWFAGVPPELGARACASLAKDGRLPPWHRLVAERRDGKPC